jgi:hypothetical protein
MYVKIVRIGAKYARKLTACKVVNFLTIISDNSYSVKKNFLKKGKKAGEGD